MAAFVTVYKVGLSLKQQFLDASFGTIPMTNHDWKVDGVFHPGGLMMKQSVSDT